MNVRALLTTAILPVLRRYFPEAEPADLGFFGGYADISSALPKKNGLDLSPETVYNIRTAISIGGAPLFSDAVCEAGFLGFTLSGEALEVIAGALAAESFPMEPSPVIELGATPECIHARLLDAAHALPEAPFKPPAGEARAAFWHLIAADTPSSLEIALRQTEAALDAHRRSPVFTKAAVLAMASAVSRFISK